MNLCVSTRRKHDGEAEPVPLRLAAGAEQHGQRAGVDELRVAEVDDNAEPFLEKECELVSSRCDEYASCSPRGPRRPPADPGELG